MYEKTKRRLTFAVVGQEDLRIAVDKALRKTGRAPSSCIEREIQMWLEEFLLHGGSK